MSDLKYVRTPAFKHSQEKIILHLTYLFLIIMFKMAVDKIGNGLWIGQEEIINLPKTSDPVFKL